MKMSDDLKVCAFNTACDLIFEGKNQPSDTRNHCI